jgi:uncharacterized membrane protein (DUF485 family)
LLKHREPVPPPEAHSAEAPAEERDSRPGSADGFDWWAAPPSRPRAAEASAWSAEAAPEQAVPEYAAPEHAEPEQAAPEQALPEPSPGPEARVQSEVFRGVAEGVAEPAETFRVPRPGEPARAPRAAEVYRHVQAGEEFQEVRREYRRFVFPACAAFLAWYLAYIVAAVTLPGLMARQLAGPFTVAWALGLLQFGSTFLITWLYARHARDRRDRLALGLRWETQDRLR